MATYRQPLSRVQSRGPTQRSLRFSQTAMPELLEALAQARARLHLMGGKDRSAELQTLSKSELATLRKEILALQTDLRAELRRRGPV
jgi:hypothetical protein